jgi:hypothetical protein
MLGAASSGRGATIGAFLPVRAGDRDQVADAEVDTNHGLTGLDLPRPAHLSSSRNSEGHEPASTPVRDGGAGDPCDAGLDPPGKLPGGVVQADPSEHGEDHPVSVRGQPDTVGERA